MDARVKPAHDELETLPAKARLFDKGRELCALVGHEHGDQFRSLGVARIGRYQMGCAGRLEERLADLEGLERTAGKLRADLAFTDIGGNRARMPMRAGKSAGTIEHAPDRDALARHLPQPGKADRPGRIGPRAPATAYPP